MEFIPIHGIKTGGRDFVEMIGQQFGDIEIEPLSFKCSQLISRIYRILLGEEDLPTSERNKFFNNKSYTDKVYNKAIDDMIKDKDR